MLTTLHMNQAHVLPHITVAITVQTVKICSDFSWFIRSVVPYPTIHPGYVNNIHSRSPSI